MASMARAACAGMRIARDEEKWELGHHEMATLR
jgi:hypothetical protein